MEQDSSAEHFWLAHFRQKWAPLLHRIVLEETGGGRRQRVWSQRSRQDASGLEEAQGRLTVVRAALPQTRRAAPVNAPGSLPGKAAGLS